MEKPSIKIKNVLKVIYRGKELVDCTDEEVFDALKRLVKKTERTSSNFEQDGRMAKFFGNIGMGRTAISNFESEKKECISMAEQIKAELVKRGLSE